MSRHFFPSSSYVLPLTTIRRERTLPWQGEVLVRVGQPVEPSDVVARAGKPRAHLIVNVAKKFHLEPDKAEACIVKAMGEPVQHGETLAQYKESYFNNRKLVSPVQGRITQIAAGRILIRPMPELYELRALIPGIVANISPSFGATIETPGALIQGRWGSGQEGHGVLRVAISSGEEILSPGAIDMSFHGCVVVCGATLTPAVLEKAQEIQVRGFIAGGVPARLTRLLSKKIMPVIATEGMGSIPLSTVTFNLLKANEGRDVMIMANAPGRWLLARPEIVIPLPATTSPELPPQPGQPLRIGSKIRITRAPYQGVIGTVQKIFEQPKPIENGIVFRGAEVMLDSGLVTFVPHVNLEILDN